MASMSSVAGLSKYIKTLPRTRSSAIGICILSFLTGVLYCIINPQDSLTENLFLEGLCTLMIFGISSILSGSLNQYGVKVLHGINLKMKHSMFLSLVSMFFICSIQLIGGFIALIIHEYLFVNSLLFGCVIIYGFNTLVLWSTTQIGFSKSAIIGLIQPILILTMLVLLLFLWSDPSILSTSIIISTIIKRISLV